MRCPKCNYEMEPFDAECLRCAQSENAARKQDVSSPNQPAAFHPRHSRHPETPQKDGTRCPYCHEWVKALGYPEHRKQHDGFRPDGQQTEYITLPPEDRDPRSLEGVPRVYYHSRCGSHTGMPEEIIRSYLQDPYLYYGDHSFCGGCHKHIPCRELVWVETGENMQAYNDRLRAAHPEKRPLLWQLKRLLGSI